MKLDLDAEILEPLVARVVEATLRKVEAEREQFDGRLAYSEEEASRLLGIKSHSLKEARLAGRIQASRIVGRRVRYSRDDLLDYMASTRTTDWKRG